MGATKQRRRKKDAALITDARASRIDNYDHRRHTYAILQWSRIPLLLLSGASLLWWHIPWLAAIFIVISVPMPWIAVVIANGVGEPADKRAPRVYKPAVVREQNRRWAEQQRQIQLAAQNPERLALGTAGESTTQEPPTEQDQQVHQTQHVHQTHPVNEVPDDFVIDHEVVDHEVIEHSEEDGESGH